MLTIFFFPRTSLTSSFPCFRDIDRLCCSITKRWFRIFVLCIVFFIVCVVERVVFRLLLLLLVVVVVVVSNSLARRRRSRTHSGDNDASDANVLRAKRESSFPRRRPPLFDASVTPRRDPDSFDATSRPLVDTPTLLNVLLRESSIALSTIAPFLPCDTKALIKLVLGVFFA